ncbi:MAG: hypothetical protein R3F14_24105 [Polyangiaceae bacterium]
MTPGTRKAEEDGEAAVTRLVLDVVAREVAEGEGVGRSLARLDVLDEAGEVTEMRLLERALRDLGGNT